MTEVASSNNPIVNNKLHRSSSVLSNNGNNRRKKWTINTAEGLNSDIMDEERNKFRVYEYLCHVGEAKEWMERMLKKELAPISEFETQLQYGVTLAELARLFSEESVKKIFENERLQFRHSDNINYFFDALRNIKFPEIFYFETTDCYEKKNTPKVIYCLHALSHFLELRGYGKAVRDLVGKLEFTDKEVQAQLDSLKENNINLPTFNNLENKLQEELKKTDDPSSMNFEKREDSSDLDEFVPSQSFYRSESRDSIKDIQKDTQSLQKEMFKASQEKENEEKQRLENERLENERLEKERLEKEKLEKEKLENERLEKERLEKERLEKERLEKEKLEKEKLEKEKLEKERLEKERLEKEKESATREVNEKTKLLEENENMPANDKSVQTDNATQDNIVDLLKDRRNWLIIVLVISLIHSFLSGGSKKE